MTRLVQIQNGATRAVALVEEPRLRLLDGVESIFRTGAGSRGFEQFACWLGSEKVQPANFWITIRFTAAIPNGDLLPPIDHPDRTGALPRFRHGPDASRQREKSPARCTSARESELTDSMKMFRWGVEGGKPAPGKIGVAPEWFYKGCGTILRAHGEPLEVPAFAEDGGEEAEIAGVYFVGEDGTPRRIGMAIGNEFSDHKFEKKNYLNLAGSKLRTCSLGPELVIDPEFQSVPGNVTIERAGQNLVVEGNPHRRKRNVPQPGQHRTSSFQI